MVEMAPAGMLADARKSRETTALEPLPAIPYREEDIWGPGPPPLANKVPRSSIGRRTYGTFLPMPNANLDAEWPRAEVLWLVKRLERSEYERGQLKAANRRLLRRLRKLRHKRGHR